MVALILIFFELNVSILPMDFYNSFSFERMIFVTGKTDEDTMNRLNEELLMRTGVQFDFERIISSGIHETIESLSYNDLLIVVLCAILFALPLYKENDQISKYKIEGYSRFEIFYEILFKDFLRLSCLSLIILVAIMIAILNSNFSIVFISTIKYFLMMLGIVLSIDLLVYWMIMQAPIVASIKGKQYVRWLKNFLNLLKIGCVILFLLPFLNGLNSIIQFIDCELNYYQKVISYENVYVLNGRMMTNSNYQVDEEQLYDDLKQHPDVNWMFHMDQSTLYENTHYVNIDDDCLNYYNIDNPEENTIFIPLDQAFTDDDLTALKKNLNTQMLSL